jgi:small subunit ribosomal protein S6
MAKLTQSYEAVIIFNTKLGDEGIVTIVEKFKDLIIKNGGTIDSVDEWGKRRLAYPIKDETDGFYVMYNFTSAPDLPAELDRVLKITDGVLRSLIVTKE